MILVAGAGGQVGREIVRCAKQRGLEVSPFTSSELDIRSEAAIAGALEKSQPAIVINAAAYTAVDRAESEQELAYAVNATGPGLLAEACARNGIPLIHLSTDYVFDGSKRDAYLESDEPNPVSVYGASKLEGERRVAAAGGSFRILRISWVFGQFGNNFVKTMLRVGAAREQLQVVDDQHGAPTAAADVASLLCDWAEDYLSTGDRPPSGVRHFVSGPSTTWYGFARNIFSAAVEAGLMSKAPLIEAISSEQYPTPVKRPANSLLASEYLAGAIHSDWRPALKAVMSALQSSS